MSFNLFNSNAISDISALKNYFNGAFGKWQEALQIFIIVALALAFVIILIFAIANPSKRKKRKEEKIHELHEKLVELKNKILTIDDQIEQTNINVEQAEITAQSKISALVERERQIYESELIQKAKCKDKISELAGKQEIITELQHKQQTGMILSMKKSQDSGTNSKRADVLEKNIADINRELESYRLEQKVKKDSLSSERNELENELDKLLLADKKLCKRKNSSPSAKNEIMKLRARREAEIKSLEELRIAKEEYELACQKRIQAEKNRKTALENLKHEEESKRKLAELIKQAEKSSERAITQYEVTPQDTHDVQLIISDPNEDGVPTFSEIPINQDIQQQEAAAETKSENTDCEKETFEQLSFNDDLDEVVFTSVDAYADDDTDQVTPCDESGVSIDKTEKTDNDLRITSDANIDGFTPKEPLNLWKIVRPNSEFIAYLTVRGRKIARTNLCTNVVEVKKSIRQACFAVSKNRISFITENGKYYFIVSSKHGKAILTGEKQYSEEACKSDSIILKEACKCAIKEII